jgi:NHLM bacteriocin system ABC transporter ATP-binding protein
MMPDPGTLVDPNLELAGARRVQATGGAPMVTDGEGVLVVTEGMVDVFFVANDDQGRPRRPEFVVSLTPGQVLERGWWRESALALPAGRGVLRAIGEATLIDVPAGAELPGRLLTALPRWRAAAAKFAAARPGENDASDLARAEERASFDVALDAEAERALLRVFEFEALARRPTGLSPLALALADAAELTGAPVDQPRLTAVARQPDPHDDIHELAARLRVPIRKVSLQGRWWRGLAQPHVVFRAEDPLVALPDRRGALLLDGGQHIARIDGTTAAELAGEGYAVYPRLPDRPLALRDLTRLGLHGGTRSLLRVAALTLLMVVVGAVLPYATSHIIGVIVPAGLKPALFDMLLALAVFVLAYLAATVTQSLTVLGLSSRAATGLTAALWDRLLNLSPAFFRGRPAGQLSLQVTAIDQMRSLIGSSLVGALAGSGLAVAALAILIGWEPEVALFVIPVFLVTLVVAAVLVVLQGRALERVIDERNQLNGLLLGFFSGISKLRVAGAERRAHALWRRGYAFQQEAQRDASLRAVNQTVLGSLLSGLYLLAVVVASATVQRGTASISDFSLSVAAAGQLAAATSSMLVLANTFVQLRPLYRSAGAILQTPPETHALALPPVDFKGDISVQGVTFGYEEGEVILDDVSFQADAGSFVAIVGPSGAGKTTISRILLGFERPWNGAVLLDGKPIDTLDVQAVRRRMGTVIQGAKITAGTILTNILGTLPLGQDAAWEAAEMAGVADDIRAMPMRMSTMVAEGGSGFSGGQIQRLLLARALVRKPKILLLDEATSALDNETQRAVMARLGEVGVTRIVIAHRISTVQLADHIVVLDRGKVVEDARFDELMARGGLFVTLARRQML